MNKIGPVIPLLLGLAAVGVRAQTPEPVRAACALTIAGISYHFDRRQQWNERNPGAGVECRNLVAGYYRNSYHRDTWYAGYAWRPRALTLGPVRAGLIGGVTTGYDLPVLIAPTLEVRVTDSVWIDLIGAPSIGKRTAWVGAQLKVGF